VTRWIRTRPDPKHDVLAVVVAAAAGATLSMVVFYLTRLVLPREPLAGPSTEGDRRGTSALDPDQEG
jgi:hypothetical protein